MKVGPVMLPDLRILIVEDDEPKLRALADFMAELVGKTGRTITEARSHASAIRALDGGVFDLAILDMSLPSFDLARDTQGGGPPQGFGGRELLRHLEAEHPSTKAVVVSQYPNFSEMPGAQRLTLVELGAELKEEFGDQFLGIVYYSGKQGAWRSEVRQILSTTILEGRS